MDPIQANSNPSGALPTSIDPASGEPSASSLAPCGVKLDPLSQPSQELAVRALLEAYSRPSLPVSVPVAGATETGAGNAASPRTDNNAARTSQRTAPGAYAQAGYTSNGDGVFAGVAALEQHDAKSGVDVEVFTASGQFGAQTELQAGVARIGGSFGGDSLEVPEHCFKGSAGPITLGVCAEL